MSLPVKQCVLFAVFLAVANAMGTELDTIGGTLLHQVDPSLKGTGVRAGQVEGDNGATGEFEVNPADASVIQPAGLFTWISSSGTATTFPNSVGTDSGHADFVAGIFYGTGHGMAPQVSHVDNYGADYFYNNVIVPGLSISGRVVNQSFIFTAADGSSHLPVAQEQMIDSHYDDSSVQNGALFISGAGNGGTVYPAATSYNGIGVGAIDGGSSVGPTSDDRCKPDIVSPGGFTSFSTPYVSGSAAVLIQAGLRGDGGANTNAASDNRTVKALLLNGAVKPSDWTNSPARPLDLRYGAGVLNVFNSWHQLKGGQHPFIEATSTANGNPHPPGASPGNESALSGWDFNSLTNADSSHDRINHYYFNLTGSNSFTLTTTLVWLRPHSSLGIMAGINDLNLFLYNTANSNLVLSSTSAVDNVEHLFLPTLPPGRYDLQVQKNASDQVSANETYALTFEFFQVNPSISQANGNAVITWPLAPAGFQLESTTNLNPPVAWAQVTNAVTVDTNASQNVVVIPATGFDRFFRLQRP